MHLFFATFCWPLELNRLFFVFFCYCTFKICKWAPLWLTNICVMANFMWKLPSIIWLYIPHCMPKNVKTFPDRHCRNGLRIQNKVPSGRSVWDYMSRTVSAYKGIRFSCALSVSLITPSRWAAKPSLQEHLKSGTGLDLAKGKRWSHRRRIENTFAGVQSWKMWQSNLAFKHNRVSHVNSQKTLDVTVVWLELTFQKLSTLP